MPLPLSEMLASYFHAGITFAPHVPAGSPPQEAFLSLFLLKHLSLCENNVLQGGRLPVGPLEAPELLGKPS